MMTLLTGSGVAFVLFNILRLVSIVATILVFAATLEMMVLDGREAAEASREDPDVYEDCEYVPGTDVPTHTWGLAWAQLNRTFILALCIICVFSGESPEPRTEDSSTMTDSLSLPTSQKSIGEATVPKPLTTAYQSSAASQALAR